MLAFPITLLIAGLILFLFRRKINADIEKLDANYLGDLIPDEDEKAMYNYDKKQKIRLAKMCNSLGGLLIFWGTVFLILMIFF